MQTCRKRSGLLAGQTSAKGSPGQTITFYITMALQASKFSPNYNHGQNTLTHTLIADSFCRSLLSTPSPPPISMLNSFEVYAKLSTSTLLGGRGYKSG